MGIPPQNHFESQSGVRTLANGLRVVWHDLANAHSIYLGAFVPGGKLYETQKTNGVSHLLEHLHFATSRKYPTRAKLSQALSSIPGEHNGFTSPYFMEFRIVTGPRWIERATELLADLLQPLETVPQEMLAAERRLILSELAADTHLDLEFRADTLLFGPEPFGLPAVGTRKSLRRLDVHAIIAADAKFFQPQAMVVALAGPVNASALQAVEMHLGCLPRTSGDAPTIPDPGPFRGPAFGSIPVRGRTRDLYVGFLLVPEKSAKDRISAWFLDCMLTAVDGCLFDALRYGSVNSYHWNSWVSSVKGAGTLQVWSRVRPQERTVCLREIFRALGALARGDIDNSCFEACRARLLHSVESALDHPTSIGFRIGSELCRSMYRPCLSLADERAAIESLTLKEFADAARQMLRREQCCVLIEGRRRRWWDKTVRSLLQEFLP